MLYIYKRATIDRGFPLHRVSQLYTLLKSTSPSISSSSYMKSLKTFSVVYFSIFCQTRENQIIFHRYAFQIRSGRFSFLAIFMSSHTGFVMLLVEVQESIKCAFSFLAHWLFECII